MFAHRRVQRDMIRVRVTVHRYFDRPEALYYEYRAPTRALKNKNKAKTTQKKGGEKANTVPKKDIVSDRRGAERRREPIHTYTLKQMRGTYTHPHNTKRYSASRERIRCPSPPPQGDACQLYSSSHRVPGINRYKL